MAMKDQELGVVEEMGVKNKIISYIAVLINGWLLKAKEIIIKVKQKIKGKIKCIIYNVKQYVFVL